MKKAICLFFALALVLSVSAAASATILTLPYNLTSGSIYVNAADQWAKFTVRLPSGDQLPTDISSYTPTLLTLTLTVVDPTVPWKVIVGNPYGGATQVTGTTIGSSYYNGTVTFTLNTSDFINSASASHPLDYNWYDSSIVFYAWASGCHVKYATYTVNATPTNTPEPGTILLLGLGLAGFAVLSMKFRPGTAAVS